MIKWLGEILGIFFQCKNANAYDKFDKKGRAYAEELKRSDEKIDRLEVIQKRFTSFVESRNQRYYK